MLARITTAYQAAYDWSMEARAGEKLALGKRDTEFPGWIWCSHSKGLSGWVPEAYLRVEGDQGILLQDYTTKELSVQPGEFLQIRKSESGWVFASKTNGETGWVPESNLEYLPEYG